MILLFRLYISKDNDEIAISAILMLLLMATIAIIFTPVLDTKLTMFATATSITQFLYALTYVLAWTDTKIGIGIAIIHVPVLLLIFHIWRNSNFQSTPILFISTVALWLFGKFIGIA